MRIRSVLPAVLVLVLGLAPSAAAATTGHAVFRLDDPRLDEISGLAVGHRNPNLLYVQNDTGDSARFFALDARTGTVKAECAVPGATNQDWEDLATGSSATGVASVWLADSGDNDGVRSAVQLYRVDEPAITGAGCSVAPPQVWQLSYPDGPHDAESLLVDPIRHRAYLVTKQLLGHSEVFEVPADPSPQVQRLTRVAEVQFQLTGTAGGPNPIGQLTATGASMSADGRLLAIRTYTDAYLWPVTDGKVAAALTTPPAVVALPAQPQGEGIAIEGKNLLIDSEQVRSTVYAVPIPAELLAQRSTMPTPTASRSAAASSSTTSSHAAADPTSVSNTDDHRLHGATSTIAVGVTVAVLAGLIVAWRSRRRR